MRFRRGAQLDSSQVSDRRGMGPVAAGGGGIIGIIVLVVSLLNDGGTGTTGLQLGEPGADLSAECTTGDDANQRDDCRIVGVVNGVQSFWSTKLDGYQPAKTVFFSGSVGTGCGGASSAVGPFYCPRDQQVHIDLGFYDDSKSCRTPTSGTGSTLHRPSATTGSRSRPKGR